MMKKLILCVMTALLTILVACNGNNNKTDATSAKAEADGGSEVAAQKAELPDVASTFVKENFPSLTVKTVENDNDGNEAYEVLLSDNSKIEFDADGNWTEIDCGKNPVPEPLVPQQILEQVKTASPDASVVQIEMKDNAYEIELSDDTEMKFDKDFKLVSTDK